MNAQKLSWKYLATKTGSHYQQLFVDGTRIAAQKEEALATAAKMCDSNLKAEDYARIFGFSYDGTISRKPIAPTESR